MIFLGDDEETCNALGSEDSCNANDKCSWCKAAAVASACHSINNAKKLPAAVFQCSKVDSQIETEKMPEDLEIKVEPTPIEQELPSQPKEQPK